MRKRFILLMTFCFLMCGCSNYAELNRLSIVTAAAIDKSDDGYELTFLIANSPKTQTTSKEGEATTTVYSGKGKSIPEAVKALDKKSPKQLYFSHINVVVISEEVGKEGFLNISDWLIRHPQTRNQFYLLQVNDDKAKNVLKIISPLESFPSQSIATLIEANSNSRSVGDTASYSNFIGRVLEVGYEPIMPTIKINGSVKEGSTQKNIETAEPKTYLSLGPLAVYRGDKLIGTTSKSETEAIHILNNEAKELIYTVKFDDNYVNVFSNTLNTKIKLTNSNRADVYVGGTGTIYGIHGSLNLDSQDDIKRLEKALNKKMKRDLEKLILKMQSEYESDIFGFGNLVYKNYPKRWKEIGSEWNKKYFKEFEIVIHTSVKVSGTGTLTETLEEANK